MRRVSVQEGKRDMLPLSSTNYNDLQSSVPSAERQPTSATRHVRLLALIFVSAVAEPLDQLTDRRLAHIHDARWYNSTASRCQRAYEHIDETRRGYARRLSRFDFVAVPNGSYAFVS